MDSHLSSNIIPLQHPQNSSLLSSNTFNTPNNAIRFCSKTHPDEKETKPLTRKEKLKLAVKEYGSTVIIFHVTISLVSLGACYTLVSRYVSKYHKYTP